MPRVPDRDTSSRPSFAGLRVLVVESRRAREMASLVTTYGGTPISAPSMREVPLESNTEAAIFADGLERGEFDLVVLLTGVGTRALVAVVEAVRGSPDTFLSALRRTRVVARGPKPVAVCREFQVPVWMSAPEPNTWRELLAAFDAHRDELSLEGLRVAVQEYGVANPELLAGLEARGARVTRVPVYQWDLPEDLEPLRAAIRALSAGEVDVALFTTATQVVHLLRVAEDMGARTGALDGLRRAVVASIGPTTTEELRRHDLDPDLEASHSKMGFLVREAAGRAGALLEAKRASRT